mmetsp:Transcript_36362/g.102455  ORF Transcript_36362/g.102455 Transcript_36362/m.102455 type:complete len:295 (+) Transcript_36362:1360-2244(+)
MPPKMAAMGDSWPEQVLEKALKTSSSSSSTRAFPAWVHIAFAVFSSSAASSSEPGAGRRLCVALNWSRARNAQWSCPGRESLAKSQMRNSPGSSSAFSRGLKLSVLGSLTCTTRPPETYSGIPRVSQSSSNEYALTFFTRNSRPFRPSMPWTSRKVTSSPSWNCTRSSSTHVTRAGDSWEMEDTMAECGCSPSTSCTTCAFPKSQNTLPNTPLMSALTSAGRPSPKACRAWETAAASASVWSHSTTHWKAARSTDPPSSAPSSSVTFTAGLSPLIWSRQALARGTPASTWASVR